MEWINVSERRPETNMPVIVTIAKKKDPKDLYVADDVYYEPDGDYFAWWNDYTDMEEVVTGVIAWMPYPKPYGAV